MNPLPRLQLPAIDIIHNLHNPNIVHIPNSLVAVPRDLIVLLGDRREHRMRMQVPASGRMVQPHHISVFHKLQPPIRIVSGLVPCR